MRIKILSQEVEVEEGMDILPLSELKQMSQLNYCGHGDYEISFYVSDIVDLLSKLSIRKNGKGGSDDGS